MSGEDWVEIRKDPAHVARERRRARELRASAWWRAQLDRGRCHYCGGAFPPGELTMDHLVPVARGGRSVRGNVVPCCAACNASKRCLTPAERILAELDVASEAGKLGGSAATGEGAQTCNATPSSLAQTEEEGLADARCHRRS